MEETDAQPITVESDKTLQEARGPRGAVAHVRASESNQPDFYH